MSSYLQVKREIVSVEPTIFGEVFSIPITNTFITALVVLVVFAVFAALAMRGLSLNPGRFQNAVEALYEQMKTLVSQITGDQRLAAEIFPIVAAILLYIGISNVIGLIPGFNSLTYEGESLIRTPTSDFNLPLGLAVAMMVVIQIRSIQQFGVFGYIGRYIKVKELVKGFSRGVKEGFIALVEFFVGILDILAEAAKVISLSFRLFGNMFAGELLALLTLSAVAYVLPALWLSLNLLFALVQALVFGALVAAYWTLAVEPAGDVEQATEEI